MASRRALSCILTVITSIYTFRTADAMDPNRAMSQYIRSHWGPDNGLSSGPIHAITQTADGYLWIGAENGLFRFDGFKFNLTEDTTPGAQPIREVVGLMPGDDDSLWVRLPSKVFLFRAGKFSPATSEMQEGGFVVTSMCRIHGDSVVFSVLGAGVVRNSRGRFEILAPAASLPHSPVISMTGTQNGDIWMGTFADGLLRLKDGRLSAITQRLPDLKINSVLSAGQDDLWVGTDNGIVRWNGSEVTTAGIPSFLNHVQTLAMIKDHDSNVWIGAAPKGLVRINAAGASSLEPSEHSPGNEVTAIFEGRERGVWFATANSLERLRDSVFVTYSLPEGLPEEGNGPIYIDPDGRTWFAPLHGGLYWMKDGRVRSEKTAGLNKDVIYSIAGANGEVWLGRQRSGLTRLRINGNGVTADTYTHAQGLAQNSVYAVYLSRDGTVWAGTLSGGVSHYKDGKFTTYTTANGLPSNSINAIAEDSAGAMWFATPSGLTAFSQGRWKVYRIQDSLPSLKINCLFEDSKRVLWIGSEKGLAYLQNGRVAVPENLPSLLREPMMGVADDSKGSLWIATSNHVLQVNRDELIQGALSGADVRTFGPPDGLRGSQGVRRWQTVVRDALGRIWFSLDRGISLVDPAHMPGPATVIPHIQTISADGAWLDLQHSIRIPSTKRRITFGYVGLRLSFPERVTYRYMLDGFDRGWNEPVTTRQAVYTNLTPGSYKFRVQASDTEGLWNGSEASLAIEVDPAFWQTWWFRLFCVTAILLSGWALYRIRLRQVRRKLQLRFDERLAERSRIARELHDNLLQNVTGLALQIGGISKIVTAPESAKERLQELRRQAEDCLREARQYVWDIRSPESDAIDLPTALKESGEQLTGGKPARFALVVDGVPRQIKADVRQQLLRIAREAIGNAAHHSGAAQIEARLRFESRAIHLRISDDGGGFDLDAGTRLPGHFGLATMRERAAQIHASIRISSTVGQGTSIEVTVPTPD
jgi:signal transduction histidine kinase/ligand-binding sensor domain-containing protein